VNEVSRVSKLIKRHAADDTLIDLIEKASHEQLEDAIGNVLGKYVYIYDDPWDPARDAVNNDYLCELFTANAENVAERVRGLLSRGKIIEFDVLTGDLEAVYASVDDAARKMNEPWVTDLAEQIPDADEFCMTFNDEVYDTWLTTSTCFNHVKQALIDEASNNISLHAGDWNDYARDWMDEQEIDEDADCLFYIEENDEYINCYDGELVDTVLNLFDNEDQRNELKVELTDILFGVSNS